MIIVIEGISAAGKTTYARQFGEGRWLPEIPAKASRPAANAPAEAHAQFWADHNAARFEMAEAIEREHGIVFCDTDPMKIHYAWCMERAGFDWPDSFDVAKLYAREAIAKRRLGFADLYLVKEIQPAIARKQKEEDATRQRGNFEQHLALQPHLMDWFAALEAACPGNVQWDFPEPESLLSDLQSKAPEANPRRFDVSAFDTLLERLPR